jgi:hypothetical protein
MRITRLKMSVDVSRVILLSGLVAVKTLWFFSERGGKFEANLVIPRLKEIIWQVESRSLPNCLHAKLAV